MKTTRKPDNDAPMRKPVTLAYSLWPEDGTAMLTAVEWGNGEGFDITMNEDTFSLTFNEWAALSAAFCKMNMM